MLFDSRNPVRPLCAALLAPFIAGAPLGAQPVAEGPLVLRLPVSARFLALGSVTTVSTDGDGILANPGMLQSVRGVSASLQRYGDDAYAGAFGTAGAYGAVSVGIGAQLLRYRAPAGADRAAGYDALTKAGAPALSESSPGSVAASSAAMTLGMARTIKGLRLGASVKFVEERIGASGDATYAVDLGIHRPRGPNNFALVVQNLGPGVRFNDVEGTLPRRISLGWARYSPIAGRWDVGGTAAISLEGDLFVRASGGVEAAYVPIDGIAFTARVGSRRTREKAEGRFTGGLGASWDRFAFDYAFEPMRGDRAVSHRLGLRVR